jgi:hypothetical protein
MASCQPSVPQWTTMLAADSGVAGGQVQPATGVAGGVGGDGISAEGSGTPSVAFKSHMLAKG